MADMPNNLVEHARQELVLLGEEPETIEWYLKVVEAYSSFGHSGGSHMSILPVLMKLLNYENLLPLTDDPAEWEDRSEMSGVPMWQNKRNSKMISEDSGKTYWNVEDEIRTLHVAQPA